MDVITRKVPATDYRPARISVSDQKGTITHFPWDHALDTRENHISAAVDFARVNLGLRTVVRAAITRPKADGYMVTLSTYTDSDDPYCAQHGKRFDPAVGCPDCIVEV